jgi:hypothetical protein
MSELEFALQELAEFERELELSGVWQGQDQFFD